jgi:uncharacterized protein (TIGR00369 family)
MDQFYQRKKELSKEASDQERQQMMEACLRDMMEEMNQGEATDVFKMMPTELVACSEKEKWLILGYPVQTWELNPGGTMHGGTIATAMDTTMWAVLHYYTDTIYNPTMTLSVNYVRPIMEGDVLEIRAQVENIGRHVGYVTAQARRRSDGKVVATAQSSLSIPEEGKR